MLKVRSLGAASWPLEADGKEVCRPASPVNWSGRRSDDPGIAKVDEDHNPRIGIGKYTSGRDCVCSLV